jgi:hypothetical protein
MPHPSRPRSPRSSHRTMVGQRRPDRRGVMHNNAAQGIWRCTGRPR